MGGSNTYRPTADKRDKVGMDIVPNINEKNFGKFLFQTVKTAPKVAVQHPPIDPQGLEKNLNPIKK